MTLLDAINLASAEAKARGNGQWARVFVDALEAKGYVMAPLVATAEMLAECLPCADTDYEEHDKKIGAAACLLLSGARNIPRDGEAVYAAAGLARDYRVLLAARPKIGE